MFTSYLNITHFLILPGYDPYDIESADEEGPTSPTPASVRSTVSRQSRLEEDDITAPVPREINKERLSLFKVSLSKLYRMVSMEY